MCEEREDLRKYLEEMNEVEEEENSPSISTLPNLACKSHDQSMTSSHPQQHKIEQQQRHQQADGVDK